MNDYLITLDNNPVPKNDNKKVNKMNNINLFYPEEYKKPRGNSEPSKDCVANLEIAHIATLICPYHHDYAMRILCELNVDSAVIAYRQDVLQDFIDNQKLEYAMTQCVEKLILNFKSVGRNYGTTHSFFELNDNLKMLQSYIFTIEELHELHKTCYNSLKSAGLRRLLDVFEESYTSKHFVTIQKEVEFLANELANGIKSITVGINLDVEMRPIQTVLLNANREHFRQKGLLESFRNKDVPENVTEKTLTSLYDKNGALDYTNKRIFDELNAIACDYRKHINTAFMSFSKSNAKYVLDLLPQIAFYSGMKKLITVMERRGLPMCRPEIAPIGERVTVLKNAYDLIFASKSPASLGKSGCETVTNDCKMDEEERIFILTGPNNGGKTTYARGIGICHVLAQAGMYVPAESARISPVDGIFTHFPKEEEVGVNTSRFTEECKALKATIASATENSLLLLNESMSSTTPSESLYVAEEMMKIFCDMGVRGIFVTHMLDLANKYNEINQAVNGKSRLASYIVGRGTNNERDYRVVKSLPLKSSYALDIFNKYGVSFDEYKRLK